MKFLIHSFLLLFLLSCNSQSQKRPSSPPADFNKYWYAGEAEITSYELEQARYGEIHQGEAVMVFVTEPFSQSKQVKLDDWKNETNDKVSVMKLNLTKKFLTGIYPYSMMMSSFKPVSFDRFPNTLKVTTSSQEWCGHTFMQLNLKKDNYSIKAFSYFESEGDVEVDFTKTILEDELWTMIRLNPEQLPLGNIDVLPGTFYLRLKHQEISPQSATAKLEELQDSDFSNNPHSKYSLEYANRSLSIYFDSTFPFTILGWEESHASGFGVPKQLTTKAKRISTIKSPYWSKNGNADRALRKELGLSVD